MDWAIVPRVHQRRRIDVADAGAGTWRTRVEHAEEPEQPLRPLPVVSGGVARSSVRSKRNDELVFLSPDGGVLRGGDFRRRQFTDAVAVAQETDADFPAMSPHDLRHTAASLPASAAMTLAVCAELFDDDLDAVAAALNYGTTRKTMKS
jgi:integrase